MSEELYKEMAQCIIDGDSDKSVELAQKAIELQMHPLDAYPLLLAIYHEVKPAITADRGVVLGNLVSFHQVGVVVVLAVELGGHGDGAVQRQGGHDGIFYRLFVDGRKHSGHT